MTNLAAGHDALLNESASAAPAPASAPTTPDMATAKPVPEPIFPQTILGDPAVYKLSPEKVIEEIRFHQGQAIGNQQQAFVFQKKVAWHNVLKGEWLIVLKDVAPKGTFLRRAKEATGYEDSSIQNFMNFSIDCRKLSPEDAHFIGHLPFTRALKEIDRILRPDKGQKADGVERADHDEQAQLGELIERERERARRCEREATDANLHAEELAGLAGLPVGDIAEYLSGQKLPPSRNLPPELALIRKIKFLYDRRFSDAEMHGRMDDRLNDDLERLAQAIVDEHQRWRADRKEMNADAAASRKSAVGKSKSKPSKCKRDGVSA